LARADPKAAQTYEALLRRAKHDPAILSFWLGGSRGMGRPTEFSDYDVGIIVAEDAYAPFCRELGFEGPFQADWRPGVDLAVRTLRMFEAFAAWGTDEACYRYAFAHLKALVDKTGRAQALIDAKARVPADAIAGFIHASLDHALNQAYRGLKCLRDGDPAASRLEAVEGINPFLDALFALHGGRLRPYFKYLSWELEAFGLDQLPFDGSALLERLMAVLGPGGAAALSGLLAAVQDPFRAAGHGGAFDGWGEKLTWILGWRPPGDATGINP
jgi:hypothetical protein